MSEQTNALHLARSRILELEQALEGALGLIDNLVHVQRARLYPAGRARIDSYRSVLNKENGNTPYDEGPFTIADDRPTPAREDDGDNAWFHDADMGDR